MFSENDRISGRQAFRLLTYDLLGLSTLLMPTVLGKVAGRDGIFCIGIGVAACLLYLKLIEVIVKDMKAGFHAYLEEKLGKIPGKLVGACYFVYLILLAGYTAYLFSDVVLRDLLREESFYLVLTVIMVLTAYGLWGGIEGRARVYEMLFWFLMIPLFLMLFFALDEIRVEYWTPVFVTDGVGIFEGSYYVFCCLAVVFLVLFLGGYVEKKKLLMKAGRRAVLFTGGVHAVLYLILLGIFGAKALGEMEYPAVTLMSTVKISGGFLKRTDAFMFAVWFFTLYALLNSCLFYGGKTLSQLVDGWFVRAKEKKKVLITSGVSILLAYGSACCFYKSTVCLKLCEKFLWYIGTPFLVAVPLILVLLKCFSEGKEAKRVVRGVGGIVIVLLAGSIMTGCNTAELEDRDFPIEIAIQDTEDFTQAFLDVQSTGNRMIDYNHLKVMILSREFVENKSGMEELLALLEEQNEIPRNTYVVVAEDAEEILEMQDVLGESVGNYLEEQFENVSQIRKQAYPTIGMLYQEEKNRTETLFIPCVSKENDKLVMNQYYVWKRGEPAGSVDQKVALLAYFTGNQVEDYSLILEDGAVVSLFDAHNEVDFTEQEGGRMIVVNVHCSGKMKSWGTAREQEGRTVLEQNGQENRTMLEIQVQQYLNNIAARTLKEQQVDVADSYRKLGGIRRDWYGEYEKNNSSYEQDLDIVYNVQIDWVSL